ncbi:ester cyclase [Nocardia sp. NPDC049149]|uniref:ester cyclase n=1 Tax=Nocardia sp. NPDC049149 TaxID=3364315 RepID=UPI00371472C3
MTPAEMDELFARHCAAEAANDVDAIMDTLADEIEHDAVGDPQGVLTDHAAIAERYRELFAGLDEDKMESVHRYYGADFFVDESHWYGRVTGILLGIPGNNRPVNFRILHVCEIRDNKISRENVWLDTAAIMQQLMAPA